MAKVLILYYSAYGHIETMAHAVAEGVRAGGASVDIKRVPELVPEDVAKKSHYKLDQPAPVACFRLVINGLYKSLPHHPWQGPLALASMPDAGEPGAGRDDWVLRLVRRWHSA